MRKSNHLGGDVPAIGGRNENGKSSSEVAENGNTKTG